MSWKNKIKLLCWDLDGTLYPNNPKLKQHITDLIINSVVIKKNWTKKVAKEKIKRKTIKLKSTTKALDSFGINGSKFFTNIWDTIDFSLYITTNHQLAKMFSKSKIKNAMFTNSNTLKNVKTKLNTIGINPKDFSFIMTSTQIGFTKPDKKVFQAIIKKAKLEPDEILYIGDREFVDIIPARKLGIKTCILYKNSKHADICAKNPIEVLNLFDENFS